MVKQTVTILNPTGLHLRPAGKLCETAMKFQSLIQFQIGTTTANAKSLLAVLASGVRAGDEIELSCEGVDEQEAMEALVALIEDRFGE